MDASRLYERTLVLLKPDAVQRGLVGTILARFEEAGLKIVALKLLLVDPEFVSAHYPNTPEWIRGMGKKTLASYEEHGKDPIEEVGTDDPQAIGEMVKGWNVEYLTSGPVAACVVEGLHAIQVVRKMCGHTLPYLAEPGTIRGDFSVASPIAANLLKRAVRNLIHASSTPEEAGHEIAHWFSDEELVQFDSTDESALF
ncbi:MAG: nucleoside-diphosphate kinase [Anaerolineae bacterium]